MKKKIVIALLVSAMIVSTSATGVAPEKGAGIETQTAVAVQAKTTNNYDLMVTAGVLKDLNASLTPITIEQNEYEYMGSSESEDIESISIVVPEESENPEVSDNLDVTEEKTYITGYTTTNVNVRTAPNYDSDVITVFGFAQEFQYTYYDDKFVEILYQDGVAYICSDYITAKKPEYRSYSMPNNKGFKSYMAYTTITSKSSKQYELQLCAGTDPKGLRTVTDRYTVAVGTAYNMSIGTYFDLVLQNGTIIPCILGDVKAPAHTDVSNQITAKNGCVSEFIINPSRLAPEIRRAGDVSKAYDGWDSPVVEIRVYTNNYFGD